MENFPTKGQQLVPLAANLATLVVVVSATWWSSAQRPDAGLPNLASTAKVVQPLTNARSEVNSQTSTVQQAWPVSQSALQPDIIKTVGFASTSLR